MFDIKFVLLFGEIPTNCCFYVLNDFVIDCNLSKSDDKKESITFLDFCLIARSYLSDIEKCSVMTFKAILQALGGG